MPWWYYVLLGVGIALLLIALVCAIVWRRDVREDAKDREAWSRMPGGMS